MFTEDDRDVIEMNSKMKDLEKTYDDHVASKKRGAAAYALSNPDHVFFGSQPYQLRNGISCNMSAIMLLQRMEPFTTGLLNSIPEKEVPSRLVNSF